MKELILGGARSGKSRLAQQRALASGLPVVYVATAAAGDDEMAERIARHRDDRPRQWTTIEEPLALAQVLKQQARADRCLLVDCLTLWLSNLLGCEATGQADIVQRERQALLEMLPRLPGRIILVSNEVGMGVVPLGALSRRFCDQAGWLHQELAQVCDSVILTVAGLPHYLKGAGQ